jgi:hypothetical protein
MKCLSVSYGTALSEQCQCGTLCPQHLYTSQTVLQPTE